MITHASYGVEPWCLREKVLNLDVLPQSESVFALSNGHVGWRGNLDVSLRREIISDLFFDISFYESYDSAPPSGAETTDYGIVTSLGYKF